MSDRVIALDTETTGLSPAHDRIVELASVEIEPRSGALGSHFHRYINPQRKIPPRVIAIHGITNERVAEEPHFGEIADEFVEFIRGSTLVIHNAGFDLGFLNAELRRWQRPSIEQLDITVIDTLSISRSLLPHLRRHTLDALCQHLDVRLDERTFHGALIDVRLLAAVLAGLGKTYQDNQQALSPTHRSHHWAKFFNRIMLTSP